MARSFCTLSIWLGYSNGGNIPYGYISVDSDIVGNKQKKKLAVEPVESVL